jgi:release factor glutamine methyltransferase
MVTYRDVFADTVRRLESAGVDDAPFNAAELMGSVLGADCRSSRFAQLMEETAEPEKLTALDSLTDRRISGEPLQYIIGEWEFYGVPIKVGRGVLIPRQDTEALIDITAVKWRGKKSLTVIDLCSGSGCIACALAKTLDCEKIICVEKSEQAAEYLKENLALNHVSADVIIGDVTDPDIISTVPQADIIICNPPYLSDEDMADLQQEVTYEPREALYGGADGLEFYRSITRLWKDKLRSGAMLCYEIGIGQEDDVMLMLIRHGLTNVRCREDLRGIVRCVFGFKA